MYKCRSHEIIPYILYTYSIIQAVDRERQRAEGLRGGRAREHEQELRVRERRRAHQLPGQAAYISRLSQILPDIRRVRLHRAVRGARELVDEQRLGRLHQRLLHRHRVRARVHQRRLRLPLHSVRLGCSQQTHKHTEKATQ